MMNEPPDNTGSDQADNGTQHAVAEQSHSVNMADDTPNLSASTNTDGVAAAVSVAEEGDDEPTGTTTNDYSTTDDHSADREADDHVTDREADDIMVQQENDKPKTVVLNVDVDDIEVDTDNTIDNNSTDGVDVDALEEASSSLFDDNKPSLRVVAMVPQPDTRDNAVDVDDIMVAFNGQQPQESTAVPSTPPPESAAKEDNTLTIVGMTTGTALAANNVIATGSTAIVRQSLDDIIDDDSAEEPKEVEEDTDSTSEHHINNNQEDTATTPDSNSLIHRWTSGIRKLHSLVNRILQFIASIAVRYPRIVLVTIASISIGLFTAGLFTNFRMETDTHDLWPPQESLTVAQSQWLYQESHFNYNPVELDVLIHNNHGNNVLGQEGVQRVFDVMEEFTSIDGYREGCAWARIYSHLYWVGQCQIYSVADFWNESQAIWEDAVETDADAIHDMSALYYPNGVLVDVPDVLGNTVRDNTTGLLTHADAYLIRFAIPWSNVTLDFEAIAIDRMLALRDKWALEQPDASDENAVVWTMEIRSFSSYSDEFMRAILADLWLIPIAGVIVSVFTVFFAFGKCHRVMSRGLLGIGAVLTIVASIMTSFGILFICGVPVTTQTVMVPFLMFGIGLDDAFIIFGSYNRMDPKMEIGERIKATFDEIGVGIFLTSLTSMLAFILGTFSNIPAVKWLCLYAFPAIGIDFLYQITFFIALVVLDERRIQANRMDYCTCITVPTKDDDATTDDQQQTIGVNETSGNDSDNDGNMEPAEAPLELDNNKTYDMDSNVEPVEAPLEEHDSANKPPSPDFEQQPPHIADRIMTWWATQLMQGWVKATALVVFAILIAVSIYGASQLDQDFDFTQLVPSDSYVKGYYDALGMYTDRNGMDTQAYFRYVDQSDPAIHEQMDLFIEDLVASGMVKQPAYFWLWDFQKYSAEQSQDPNTTLFALLPFDKQIEEFLDEQIYYDLYDDHIGRLTDGTVVETRCDIQVDVDTTDSKAAVDMLSTLRGVSGAQPINQGEVGEWKFFTYSNEYQIYEFYREVVEELIFTTFMGVVAISFIAFVFIPQITAVLFVFPFICVLYTMMLGFLYLSGVQINAISYVTLVMSIGLMVDYIMHILMRYYDSKGNREQRVHETLSSMGASIFLGAASTFLGVMCLAFSTSDILQTIFVSVVGLITLGVLNGLVFLPVVLSLVGPE